jgi:hypothetical protein
MSDQTAGGMPHHAHRVPKAEFFVYFALIFVLALPVQALAWLGSLLWHLSMPGFGPVRRAWADAASITPQIFRG